MSTLEPGPRSGPLFTLMRSPTRCAWAIHASVSDDIADELARLAASEPPPADLREAPIHAERYRTLVGPSQPGGGPSFVFPDELPSSGEFVLIKDEARLARHFRGWIPGEIAEGRAPVVAVLEDGEPVSVCCCARRTDEAAEAGLDTAEGFRRKGYAVKVTAAWAQLIRESGRIPMYSTAWENLASQAVARRLGLRMYGSSWDLLPSAP